MITFHLLFWTTVLFYILHSTRCLVVILRSFEIGEIWSVFQSVGLGWLGGSGIATLQGPGLSPSRCVSLQVQVQVEVQVCPSKGSGLPGTDPDPGPGLRSGFRSRSKVKVCLMIYTCVPQGLPSPGSGLPGTDPDPDLGPCLGFSPGASFAIWSRLVFLQVQVFQVQVQPCHPPFQRWSTVSSRASLQVALDQLI